MWWRVKRLLRDVWDSLRGPVYALAIIAAAIGAFSPLVYHECAVNARILNETFGTDYTAGDMFWAGETIKTVVLGQKARIDLNDTR